MAMVFIPAQLRRLTGGRDRAEARGASLGELIDDLERSFPGFRDRVTEAGDIAPALAVSVDGEMATAGLHEPVRPDSEVHFVPALGGGR
jgi:molybdopterin synthase sulfur carrier subunit